MMAKHTLYGRSAVVGSFGLLATYFFKGNSAKIKVFSGFLFLLWQPHIYTLGSHLGVYMNLKCKVSFKLYKFRQILGAINQLLYDESTQSAILTKKFIRKLRERDQNRSQGGSLQSDSSLMEEFYKELIGKEGEKIFNKSHSYVTNRYFIDNKEKYMAQNRENNPILFSPEDLSTEDKLKLPYFDSFLTRYLYHNMTRWFTRFGQFLGLVRE